MWGKSDQFLPVCRFCVKNVYDYVTGLPLTVSGYMMPDYIATSLGLYVPQMAADG